MPPPIAHAGGFSTPDPDDDAGAIAALAACVPPLVVEQIARRTQPMCEPSAAAFEGFVLFTDVSGFTRLTERMDRGGPRGAEELSRLLNDYFAGLIEIIAGHGGAVMKFAGDALIAVWSCGTGIRQETAKRVAQCGLRIQANTTRFHDGTLAMKVAIGAGEVLHFVLGSDDRWSSLISGKAMQEARDAMQQARGGEVILGRSAVDLSGVECSLELLAGGHRRLRTVSPVPCFAAEIAVPGPEAKAALLQHVPAAIRDRLAEGQTSWLAEFRTVSVVFLNVPDVRMDVGALAQLQAVVQTVHAVMARCGGVIESLAEDHDGLTCVAAFGIPNHTYENDAVRAVRSALAVRRDLRNQGYACGIGTATGRLFCGLVGNSRRRTYSMVGDAMNRCARLMKRTEHDVLCDESTRLSCGSQIEFESLGLVSLRGRDQKVSLHRPIAEAGGGTMRAAGMIGRNSELDHIRGGICALATGGKCGVIIIEGEAGIGKTTLAAEAKSLAAAAGVGAFSGRSDAIEMTSSYRPWRNIFSELLGFPEAGNEEDLEEHLLSRLGNDEHRRVLAPLLNPVLGLQFEENEITSRMAGRPRSDATSALLVQLFCEAASEAPVMVILEDCQWFDSGSWSVAAELHRHAPGLLLLLVTRPILIPAGEDSRSRRDEDGRSAGTAPPEWPMLLAAAGRDRIVLGPLNDEDTLAVACRALRVETLSPDISDFILEKAAGHPFFAGELALALRDAGHLRIEGDTCRLDPEAGDLRHARFPSSVGGVVRERLDRLPVAEQMAIKVASVVGLDFRLDVLRAVLPGATDLSSSLEALVGRELIVHRGMDHQRFAFKHAIIQDVAYHQLSFSRRQELHRAVAEWNEQDDPKNHPLLAHHWKFARATEKALHYLDLAADEAMSRFANREAAGFMEDAIALARESPKPPDRLTAGRWRRQLGEAHFHLGRVDQSRSVLREATSVLGRAMPARRWNFALELPLAVLRQCWLRAVGGWVPREQSRKSVIIVELIRAYNLLGEIAFFTNDLPASLFCTVRGLNLAEDLGPSPRLAEMYAAMVVVTAAMPVRMLARRYRSLTERTAAGITEPVSRAYAQELIGIYLNGLGSWDEAERVLSAAAEIFQRFGHGRRREECLLNIAYGHLYRGDFGQAASVLDEMQRSAARRGDEQTMGWVRLFRAELCFLTEGPAAALNTLAENRQSDRLDALTKAGSEALAAAAMFQTGQAERSLEQAGQALASLTQGPPVAYTMMLYISHITETLVGLYACGTGAERERFRKLARQARGAALRFGLVFPVGRPRAFLLQGAVAFVEGRRRLAESLWKRGRETAAALGMQHEAAYAEAHLAAVRENGGKPPHRVRVVNGSKYSLAHLGGSL